jgi:UDPglucose 6-dehydrogenase
VSSSESICVVGLWHLGSVLSACWAEAGHQVVGLDRSLEVVGNLAGGEAPIFEPGLNDLLSKHIKSGSLSFSTDFKESIKKSDIVIVAFDTPVSSEDTADLEPLVSAVRDIAPFLKNDSLIVVSSQVPVGTCAGWLEEVQRISGNQGIGLVYSPENLRLSDAIRCYLHPDRVVVGADDDNAKERAVELFQDFGAPVLTMSLASAEMTKHVLNSFLATSVSFINEVSELCEKVGADTGEVAAALKADGRIGPRAFLAPGMGFSGGTLARDVQALMKIGRMKGEETPLLSSVLEVNRKRPEIFRKKLGEIFDSLEGLELAVLGLTYKAGTSTIRRSMAIEVIESLVAQGCRIRAYDPRADLSEAENPPDLERMNSAYEAARGTSGLLVLTEWPEFKELDFSRIRNSMKTPVVLDGSNFLDKAELECLGFRYRGIGR